MIQREIFGKIKVCLYMLPNIASYLRKQMFYEGNKNIKELVKNLTDISSYVLTSVMPEEEKQEWMMILQAFLNAQENKDFILMADILERDMLFFLEKMQGVLLRSDDIAVDEYWTDNLQSLQAMQPSIYERILKDSEDATKQSINVGFEPMLASNGLPTLKAHFAGKTFCMHSTVNPEWEARELVKVWLEKRQPEYKIFGMGMGYHIQALLEMDKNIKVTVLEYRIEPLVLALHYLNFQDYILKGRLEINYESDLVKVLQGINGGKEESVFFLHYPSLQCVEHPGFKEILEDYFISTTSMLEQAKYLAQNFEYLQKQNFPSCMELRGMFDQKDVVIVAGGPSVDDQIENLKKYRQQLVILSVGTVARKLLGAGIRPDAIVITDPLDVMYRQVEGIQEDDIPLLLLSTASRTVVEYYKGPVYLVYQNGYEPAEEIAKKYGFTLFQTGGSVTTTALDIAIQFGAQKIILVGADMAYTDNRSHAKGVGFEENDFTDFRQVTSVNGEILYTTRNLDIYRKWIERRIKDLKQPVVYNTSRGAKIAGTVEAKIEDVIC